MSRPLVSVALILLTVLARPTLSPAFYTHGALTRDISYDRLALTAPPSDKETYRPIASGVLVNNSRKKISLSAELTFCNIFGEPLGSVTIRCTIPPLKKAAFEKRIKKKAPLKIKDAHHVEWTVLRLKKS